MAVQKTRTMFQDGEAFARASVMAEYPRFEWMDDGNPPSDAEMAWVLSTRSIDSLEVVVPEGADKLFYYGMEYYLRMMEQTAKHNRAMLSNPARSIRITF